MKNIKLDIEIRFNSPKTGLKKAIKRSNFGSNFGLPRQKTQSTRINRIRNHDIDNRIPALYGLSAWLKKRNLSIMLILH